MYASSLMIKIIQIPKSLSHLFTSEMLVNRRKRQPRRINSRPLIITLGIETQREPSLPDLTKSTNGAENRQCWKHPGLKHIVHLTSSHTQSLTLESITNKISHPVIRTVVSLVICMAFYNHSLSLALDFQLMQKPKFKSETWLSHFWKSPNSSPNSQ